MGIEIEFIFRYERASTQRLIQFHCDDLHVECVQCYLFTRKKHSLAVRKHPRIRVLPRAAARLLIRWGLI